MEGRKQRYTVDSKRVANAERYMKEKVNPVVEELVTDRKFKP